jgi:hypothetical protein
LIRGEARKETTTCPRYEATQPHCPSRIGVSDAKTGRTPEGCGEPVSPWGYGNGVGRSAQRVPQTLPCMGGDNVS